MSVLDDKPPQVLQVPRTSKPRLLIELVGLFFLSPLLIVFGYWPPQLKMSMLALAVIWAAYVIRQHHPPAQMLGLGREGRTRFWRCAFPGIALWALSFTAAIVIQLSRGLPPLPLIHDSPRFFLVLSAIYFASVAAQEFLFRSYFFWRFRSLASPRLLFALNAISFAWIHVVFGSWITIAFCFVGGLLFSALYLKHRTLGGICLVHFLFGLSIFAMGFGRYLAGGSEQLARFLR